MTTNGKPEPVQPSGNTPEPRYKKFFIDTEFIEAGPYLPITLLSIGIVCEDGRELYLEAEADISHAGEWVRVNVFPHLVGPKLKLEAIAARIRSFVGLSTEIEFWGYYADYDWVVFAQIFGSMMDLPNGWPMYCRDLKQLCDSLGNPKLPAQSSTEHNALHDARWNKEAFDFLVAASSKEATPAREHICEAELFERGPSDGYAKDGERWTCSCGKIYEHFCDEANGCQWNLCAEAKPSPAREETPQQVTEEECEAARIWVLTDCITAEVHRLFEPRCASSQPSPESFRKFVADLLRESVKLWNSPPPNHDAGARSVVVAPQTHAEDLFQALLAMVGCHDAGVEPFACLAQAREAIEVYQTVRLAGVAALPSSGAEALGDGSDLAPLAKCVRCHIGDVAIEGTICNTCCPLPSARVWLVIMASTGKYPDDTVMGVCSSEKLAEQLRSEMTPTHKHRIDIDEWKVDESLASNPVAALPSEEETKEKP